MNGYFTYLVWSVMLGCPGFYNFFNCWVLKVKEIKAKLLKFRIHVNVTAMKAIGTVYRALYVQVLCMNYKSFVESGVVSLSVLCITVRRGKTIDLIKWFCYEFERNGSLKFNGNSVNVWVGFNLTLQNWFVGWRLFFTYKYMFMSYIVWCEILNSLSHV